MLSIFIDIFFFQGCPAKDAPRAARVCRAGYSLTGAMPHSSERNAPPSCCAGGPVHGNGTLVTVGRMTCCSDVFDLMSSGGVYVAAVQRSGGVAAVPAGGLDGTCCGAAFG